MKKLRICSNRISVDIFDKEVVILITNSKDYLQEEIEKVLAEDLGMRDDIAKEFADELKKVLKEEAYLSSGLTTTITTNRGYKDVFCIFDGDSPKSLSKEVIIHEMFHAMRFICKICGVDDEETMAYMLDYFCRKFFEICNSFGKKDKKSSIL